MAKYLDESASFADFNELTQQYFERRKWVDLSHTNQDYVVTSRIFEAANFAVQGGTTLNWKVQKSNNTSYTRIGVGAILNPVPQDHSDGAEVKWAAAAVTSAWFVEEDDWQSGPETIVNILTMNEQAMANDITIGSENDLWSAPTSSTQNPRQPSGIPFWLQKASTGTSTTASGFNGGDPSGFTAGAAGIAVADVPGWKNWNFGYGAVSNTDLFPKLSEAIEKCYFKPPRAYPSLGDTQKPDHVIYTTFPVWEAIQSQQTASNDNLGNDVGRWRNAVMFKGVPVGWVPALTNSGSPVRDTTHPIYGVDWKNLKMFFKPGWDWVNPLKGGPNGGLEIPNGQPTARKSYKYAWYNYRCMSRRNMFVGHTTQFAQ